MRRKRVIHHVDYHVRYRFRFFGRIQVSAYCKECAWRTDWEDVQHAIMLGSGHTLARQLP